MRNLSPEELERKSKAGEVHTIIDVRSYAEYAAGHIEGSLLLGLDTIEARARDLDRSRPLALVCQTGPRSRAAAERLMAMGFSEIYCLQGGLEAWLAAGLAVRKFPGAPVALERQVRITVGSLMLLGVLLGTLVHAWFLLISGIVGAGLIWAGITDT